MRINAALRGSCRLINAGDRLLTYRSANFLVKRHGEDAPIHATMRAEALLEAGDLDGYAVWRRILRAVGELQQKQPNILGDMLSAGF